MWSVLDVEGGACKLVCARWGALAQAEEPIGELLAVARREEGLSTPPPMLGFVVCQPDVLRRPFAAACHDQFFKRLPRLVKCAQRAFVFS